MLQLFDLLSLYFLIFQKLHDIHFSQNIQRGFSFCLTPEMLGLLFCQSSFPLKLAVNSSSSLTAVNCVLLSQNAAKTLI